MATVVKANRNAVQPAVSGLVGFNLDDFAASSRQQIEAARREAEKILETARQEAEVMKQAAQEEGYAAGHKQAEVDAEQQLTKRVRREVEQRLPAMQQTVEALAQQEAAWLGEFAETLTAVAVAMAEKVIRGRLETEPAIVLQWAEEALHHIRSARQLVVAVHPETLVELGEELEKLLRGADLPETSRLEPDEAVERAGVVVRQEGGTVDVQLRTQLEKLTGMLQGE